MRALFGSFLLSTSILLGVTSAHAQVIVVGVSVDDANDDQKAAAQEAFAAGDAAFDVQRYDEALEHYQASYGAVASPNSRLMIARSLLELGRLDEAYDEYSAVIQEAEAVEGYEETAATASHERKALENRLAWLTIDMSALPEDSELEVGGRARTLADKDTVIAVTPGKTMVKATSADGSVAEAEVHLAAGRSATAHLVAGETVTVGTPAPEEKPVETSPVVAVEAPPAVTSEPQQRSSLKPWAFTAAGVAVAGLGAFTAFGLMSSAKYRNLQDSCVDGQCPPNSQSDIDQGRAYQMYANIGLGVGIAGVAASTVLFIVDAKRKPRPINVGLGFQSISVQGVF